MHLSDIFFWKHKKQNHVIDQKCYGKLPEHLKIDYTESKSKPTHRVDDSNESDIDGSDILLTALIASELLSSDNNDQSYDMGGSYDSSDSSFDFDGFGGGDTGGGGAGGDW